jgi:hypothetical protein
MSEDDSVFIFSSRNWLTLKRRGKGVCVGWVVVYTGCTQAPRTLTDGQGRLTISHSIAHSSCGCHGIRDVRNQKGTYGMVGWSGFRVVPRESVTVVVGVTHNCCTCFASQFCRTRVCKECFPYVKFEAFPWNGRWVSVGPSRECRAAGKAGTKVQSVELIKYLVIRPRCFFPRRPRARVRAVL